MYQDLGLSLLTVLGVLTGIGVLLYVLAVLDPTSVRTAKQLPTHRAPRGGADT
ncbi:hypothetical protein [uncultured Nocardioides sp.]|uniref:hypothetical protein n=1 Tax=uncultured Nocardioides sp. TaxID=198441 RepID=UPI0026283007|nr:hypothetical protein [uncultured Nocardioides sp.]